MSIKFVDDVRDDIQKALHIAFNVQVCSGLINLCRLGRLYVDMDSARQHEAANADGQNDIGSKTVSLEFPALQKQSVSPRRSHCIATMFDVKSDDSSEASSGDEMLNLVPFSQETTTSSTTPEKRIGFDITEEIQLGMKRKHDDIDVNKVSDEAKMEEKGESFNKRVPTYFRFPPHSMSNVSLLGISQHVRMPKRHSISHSMAVK